MARGSLLDLFGALDDGEVRWCLLRGRDRLAAPEGDVDVLVAPGDLERFHEIAVAQGFLRWRAWRSAGQHPYQGRDGARGAWISLHVADRLAFGPHHQVVVPDAAGVLERRVRVDGVWTSAPVDELWVTLLHGLLDKGAVHEKHRARLAELAGPLGPDAADAPVALALAGVIGPWPADAALAAVTGGDWDALESAGAELRRHALRPPRPRARAAAHVAALLGHRVTEPIRQPGRAVALLAPDGAGKTTLAHGLLEAFPVPARRVYLGLYGAEGPLHGRRPPRGLGFVVRVGWLLARRLRVRGYRALRWYVVLDRHPLDALAAPPASGRWARLRRTLLVRAAPRPDLTLVLDADGAVLHERKGEHDVASLSDAAARYRQLAGRLDRAVVLDASSSPEEVRRAAVEAIWRAQLADAR